MDPEAPKGPSLGELIADDASKDGSVVVAVPLDDKDNPKLDDTELYDFYEVGIHPPQ